MFSSSFLSKIVLQKRNSFSLSLIRFISTDSTLQNSFVISYLRDSCGLSPQKAISASKKVHFKSSTKPDSILTLLRSNGFSDSQISRTVASFPSLLVCRYTNLKPKFDFFISKGLSGADLAGALCRKVMVLGYSLEKTINPGFDFLKRIFETDEKAVAMLKRSIGMLGAFKIIESNVAKLQSHGVPISNVRTLLFSRSRLLTRNGARLSEIVEEVKKMKFEPSKYMFLVAMSVYDSLTRSSLEAKFDAYKSWGWSEDEIQQAFRKHPVCMALSEKNIMSKMDFFVKKMGYNASSIAMRPSILHYSLEKRIIPRCSVIQFLVKTGLIQKLPELKTLVSILSSREDVFLEKFIIKFDETIPELRNVYKQKSC